MQRLNSKEGITSAQWAYISKLRDDILTNSTRYPLNGASVTGNLGTNDPITQSEQEEQIIDWLESHDIRDGWKLASELVNVGVTIDTIREIAGAITPPKSVTYNKGVEQNLKDILDWLTTTLRVDQLLYEIKSEHYAY